MSKLEKYSSYKDSGVEWLGKIPEHWEIQKVKNIFNFTKGLTITKDNLQEEGIYCVNYGEIHSKYGFEINPAIHALKCVDESYLKSDLKSLLNFGDFVFADTSEDIEGSGNFTHLNSNIKTFAGYHTVICRSKNIKNIRFFAYLFDSITYRLQIRKRVKGVKVFSITQGILKDTILWNPPQKEQTKIASFLDEKTAQINKVISQKQKLIELLKERKQIVINDAVTKGVPLGSGTLVPPCTTTTDGTKVPFPEMKDSGVEWIGKIPKHWKLERLGSNFIERREKVSDKDFEPLSVTKNGVVPQLDSAAKSNDGDNRKLVRKGDFVINSRSDRKGSSGLSKLDGSVSLINIVLQPININSDFSHILLKSNGFIEEFYRNGHGIVADLWTTRFWDMKSIMLAIPPKDEQLQIVEHIENQTTKIDKAIELQQNYISKLKEYKASLIDSVVTGKVRVV